MINWKFQTWIFCTGLDIQTAQRLTVNQIAIYFFIVKKRKEEMYQKNIIFFFSFFLNNKVEASISLSSDLYVLSLIRELFFSNRNTLKSII